MVSFLDELNLKALADNRFNSAQRKRMCVCVCGGGGFAKVVNILKKRRKCSLSVNLFQSVFQRPLSLLCCKHGIVRYRIN